MAGHGPLYMACEATGLICKMATWMRQMLLPVPFTPACARSINMRATNRCVQYMTAVPGMSLTGLVVADMQNNTKVDAAGSHWFTD